jgi:hypothetical protein
VLSQLAFDEWSESVTDYDERENAFEAQMRIIVGKIATLSLVGDGVDPFDVIPKFICPDINSIYLMRNCKSQVR